MHREYGQTQRLSTPARRLGLSRRQFLRALAGGAVAAALARPRPLLAGSGLADEVAGTPVAITESRRVIHELQVKTHLLRDMVDQALVGLTGAPDPRTAWERFVTPGQRILLKFPRLLGADMGTIQPMLQAVLTSLLAVGHDRLHLRVADCPPARHEPGLDPLPAGWSERQVTVAGLAQPLRRYLDDIDAIISVPIIADDRNLGVSCALWNTSLSLIRYPARYEGPQIIPAVVDLNRSPEVGGQVRLTLVNALRAQYDGGPWVDLTRSAALGEVWAATDRVALDRLAWDWLESHRQAHNLPVKGEPPAENLLKRAAAEGLGEADRRRIQVRRILL